MPRFQCLPNRSSQEYTCCFPDILSTTRGPLKTEISVCHFLRKTCKGFPLLLKGLICEALCNLAPASVLFLQSLQVPSNSRIIPHLSHVLKHDSPAGWLSTLPVIPQISSQGHLLRYLPIKRGRLHAPIVSFLAIYFCELPVHLWRRLISLYHMTWSSQYLSALELNATITC